MIQSIRQHLRVGTGGAIAIQSSELAEGMVVEVIVLLEPDQDTTEYLLSTEANRQHLQDSLEHIEQRQNLIEITPEEWDEKYSL
jgi:antitoxin YefM